MKSNPANKIHLADNLEVLCTLPTGSVDLVYIDPPFNTGKRQERRRIKVIPDESNGDRTGFQGRRYRTVDLGTLGWDDTYDDFIAFMLPRFEETHRVLKAHGSFFLHVDYREVHYCKVVLDKIFGRNCFQNEIIWAYDYGARSKKRWPAKHDSILWYTRDPKNYTFNYDEIDRIPYMAPRLVGTEKAARGKTPTDVWWHTIVSPNSKEKTGYATQKPIGVLNYIIKEHSNPGDLVMDFFAGSGTTGESAARHGRNFILIDTNPEALAIMAKRLATFHPTFVNYSPPMHNR